MMNGGLGKTMVGAMVHMPLKMPHHNLQQGSLVH